MKEGFRWWPESASTLASQVDGLTWVLFGICSSLALLVLILIVFFSFHYRENAPHHHRDDQYKPQIGFQNKTTWILEIGWTIIPFFIFIVIFAYAAKLYVKMHIPPPHSYQVQVVAKQWMWKFQHPDGTRELNELHIPLGQPVLLQMISQDVIHSFFVPAFRIKQDVQPGRYVYLWFEATHPGSYHLFCTQYCGTAHSEMKGQITVMTRTEYQRWQTTQLAAATLKGGETMASTGGNHFRRFGCISCHGTPSNVTAPDLAGLYGSQVHLSNGKTVLADENYLRESILYPRAKLVMGYSAIMPSYQGVATEEEVMELIAYIKSIQKVQRIEP